MNDVKRVLALIKRTRDQPIIFHILHSHLAYTVNTKKIIPVETGDLWDKVLLASVEDLKVPRNSLETKIHQYLKNCRQKTDDDLFRLRIILYYLDTRPLCSLNMFILFELVTHHYNASPLTDTLIESVLAKSLLSKNFNIKTNKRMANDAVQTFLKANNSFSCKKLAMYIHFNLEPPLVDYSSGSPLAQLKVLESLSLYANYTANVDHFKSIVPQTQEFLDTFKKFVCKDASLFPDIKVEFDPRCLALTRISAVESLKTKIKKAFDESADKFGFRTEIIEFLSNIEC